MSISEYQTGSKHRRLGSVLPVMFQCVLALVLLTLIVVLAWPSVHEWSMDNWYRRKLRTGTDEERINATIQLGKIKSVHSIRLMLELLERCDSTTNPECWESTGLVVSHALVGMGKVGIDELARLLKDKTLTMSSKQVAIGVLGILGLGGLNVTGRGFDREETAVIALVECLRDRDDVLSKLIIDQLQRIVAFGGMPPHILASMLIDHDGAIRMHGIKLVQTPGANGQMFLHVLRDLTEEADDGIREQAEAAIKCLTK